MARNAHWLFKKGWYLTIDICCYQYFAYRIRILICLTNCISFVQGFFLPPSSGVIKYTWMLKVKFEVSKLNKQILSENIVLSTINIPVPQTDHKLSQTLV